MGDKSLHIDGLVQERCNSNANKLELHLFCNNPLISYTAIVIVSWSYENQSINSHINNPELLEQCTVKLNFHCYFHDQFH